MKKLVVLSLLCLMAISASAQDVYNEILRISTEAANNKNNDLDMRKINTFKVDELKYMAMKSKELMPDSTVRMLDLQAYAMYEYINLYIKRLTSAPKKKDKESVMLRFKNASLSNSRFHDMERDITDAYIDNPGYLTQFSLDTDWIKALEEVKKNETYQDKDK
jgi:hypothetical protein